MADAYASQWREYRRRRRWVWALGVAPLPLLWLLAAVQGEHPGLAPVAIVAGLAWLGAASVTGWRFGLWPCPRCGRPFGMRRWLD
jgi:hypothetical protein